MRKFHVYYLKLMASNVSVSLSQQNIALNIHSYYYENLMVEHGICLKFHNDIRNRKKFNLNNKQNAWSNLYISGLCLRIVCKSEKEEQTFRFNAKSYHLSYHVERKIYSHFFPTNAMRSFWYNIMTIINLYENNCKQSSIYPLKRRSIYKKLSSRVTAL